MSYLTPDSTFSVLGLTVKQKIIPNGVKALKDIYEGGTPVIKKGGKFKADKKLTDGTYSSVTIHNTDDITVSGTTKSEQYTRATYPNQNMGASRIHFYVCNVEAWQNLNFDEVGWHCSYSINPDANNTSVAIEIIGNSREAEDNGAKLAAYLLKRNKLDVTALTNHNKWTGKNCPVWILPHWDEFSKKVENYLNCLTNNGCKTQTGENCNKNCNIIYKSLGRAAIRDKSSSDSTILSRCSVGKLHLSDATVALNGKDKWFKHYDCGYYSMLIDDDDKTALFEKEQSTFKIFVTTAPLNIRKSPNGVKTGYFYRKGDKVAVVDEKPISLGGYTWVKTVYDGRYCYCAKEYLE